MELKDIASQLNLADNPLDHQIEILKNTLGSLLTGFSQMIPNNSFTFTAMARDLEAQITHLRMANVNVQKYFSGKGPLAKRLNEHLLLSDWMFNEIAQKASPLPDGTQLVKENYYDSLKDALNKFSFSILTDQQAVAPVNEFIGTINEKINSMTFKTPKPTLIPMQELTELQTGIYESPEEPYKYWTVLRSEVKTQPGLEVLSLSRGYETNVWYFHPHENIWVNSQFDSTFPGVLETLQEIFAQAIAEATPVENRCDFEKELPLLLERSHHLFDQEEFLPPEVDYVEQLHVIRNNLNKAGSGYKRRELESTITITADGVSLLIHNTKGAYPSRSHHFATNLAFSPTVVPVESMSEELKAALIERGKRVLAQCENYVRVAQAKQEVKTQSDNVKRGTFVLHVNAKAEREDTVSKG